MQNYFTSKYQTISGHGQSVWLNEVGITSSGHKIELDIRTDSYKEQSYAIARVWSPEALQWNAVFSIAPLLMQTDEKLGYRPRPFEPSAVDFEADRDTLLEQVQFILEDEQ